MNYFLHISCSKLLVCANMMMMAWKVIVIERQVGTTHTIALNHKWLLLRVLLSHVVLLLELLQLTDVYYALHGGNSGVVLKWCR